MQEKVYAKIKQKVEDFVVEEITPLGKCVISPEIFQKTDLGNLELKDPKDLKEFLWADMEKIDIDHLHAIKEVSILLNKGPEDIGYAGSKDKRAHTYQRISIFNPDLEKIKSFSHPNIHLKNFKWERRKIKIGYLEGNHFKIVIRDIDKKDASKISNKIRKSNFFPNYFGSQRFGRDGKNPEVGKMLLKKEFEKAVIQLIKDSPPRVAERANYHLSKNPNNFLGALKLFPRKNLLIIVNSVQSKIFNEILKRALDEGLDFTKEGQQNCILPGYKTRFYDGKLGIIEQGILKQNGLELEDFNLAEIPFLRMKGSYRKALTEVKDLDITIEDDEEFSGSKKIILEFSLPSGVYATTYLENFFTFNNTN